ncbi:protein translocase subunit secE/sec61 gamma [Limimonas halophila]|uniref:Protein translocase subunit SecE n=1 Tax=Limimonas halophila TaxID=1082479 RepID=A0A1G7V4C7_9PROT|nr:preprotein translocase subunit SecE [Limimonas halophila]SDG54672.1 protein translocase subunit secE/sec61 gamma [Limimonas halophila]
MASKFNPGQFIREVRHETSKVTWPSRRETAITTVMVLAFTALAAIFLFLVDQVISLGVSFILGVGG